MVWLWFDFHCIDIETENILIYVAQKKRKSYRFRMTWGYVNDYLNFHLLFFPLFHFLLWFLFFIFNFFSRFDILKYVVEKSHKLTSTTEMHSLLCLWIWPRISISVLKKLWCQYNCFLFSDLSRMDNPEWTPETAVLCSDLFKFTPGCVKGEEAWPSWTT